MAATIHPLAGCSWTVQGPVHAQPFYYHPAGTFYGLIILATDNATVVALNSQTGQTVWARSPRTPVPRRQLARLLDQVREDDIVVVARLDRRARSTRDLLDIAEQLKEAGMKQHRHGTPCQNHNKRLRLLTKSANQ